MLSSGHRNHRWETTKKTAIMSSLWIRKNVSVQKCRVWWNNSHISHYDVGTLIHLLSTWIGNLLPFQVTNCGRNWARHHSWISARLSGISPEVTGSARTILETKWPLRRLPDSICLSWVPALSPWEQTHHHGDCIHITHAAKSSWILSLLLSQC